MGPGPEEEDDEEDGDGEDGGGGGDDGPEAEGLPCRRAVGEEAP